MHVLFMLFSDLDLLNWKLLPEIPAIPYMSTCILGLSRGNSPLLIQITQIALKYFNFEKYKKNSNFMVHDSFKNIFSLPQTAQLVHI